MAEKHAGDCTALKLMWPTSELRFWHTEVLSHLCFGQCGCLIYLVHQLPTKALRLRLWLIHAQPCLEPLPSARHNAGWEGSTPEMLSVLSSITRKLPAVENSSSPSVLFLHTKALMP